MGIEKLRGSLLSEANDEAERIVKEARIQAASILEEERKSQETMDIEAIGGIERTLEEERNERLAWARLEAKRITAEAEEDAIKGVMEEIIEALSTMHGSPEYKAFLRQAVDKAAEELGGSVVIHVQKGEKAYLQKGKNAKIEEDLDGQGGAIVETMDGRVRVNVTLEMFLESRRDDLRKKIHMKLFGGR